MDAVFLRLNWVPQGLQIALVARGFATLLLGCMLGVVGASAQQNVHHEATAILLDYLDREDGLIRAMRQDRGIAEESIRRAQSTNDPTISGSLSVIKTLSDIDQQSGNDGRIGNSYQGYDLTASLKLRKTLMDWGRKDSQIRIAQLSAVATEHSIRQQTEATYLAALSAYYTTLRSLARVQLHEKSLGTLQTKLEEAQQRLQVGLNDATQLAVAEASLALGNSNLAQEKSALESALNNLKIYAPENFEQHFPEEVIFPAPSARMQGISLERAQEEQKIASPAIANALQATAQAKAQLETLNKVDDPDLVVSLNVSRSHNSGHTQSHNTVGTATVTLTVPLLSSGTASSDVRRQQQQISKARLQYRAMLDQQSTRLKRAWNEFHVLDTVLSAEQKNVEARQTLLVRAQKAFEVGKFAVTQVLDEENKLLEAELQVIDTQYNQLLKSYEITNLIGWLLRDNIS
ncbi:MAG: TolC family protein [Alphaproteobacteria bacterium]|nr:TolC family protein [Alphaproteobacteria bacterium]